MSLTRLNPVAWTEGMLLRPQHLQHHALYSDERLRYHLRALEPFHWGVREVAFDEDALAEGRVVVFQLDAVMPGGTIVRYRAPVDRDRDKVIGNVVLGERNFDTSIEKLDVFLGLRNVSESEANAAPAGNGARNVRYVLRTEELPDLVRGGFEAPVDLAYPNLRLFLSGEEADLEGFESFKLAEVVATGDLKRAFALSRAYVPPLLAIQAAPLLSEEIAKIVSQISSKVRVVAGRTATIAIADLPRMWMRYTLARMTPLLRHLLSTGETRPFELYSALVECAGALAAFSHPEAVELPLYSHTDLYGCFHELIRFIDVELGESIPTRFVRLDMPFDAAKKYYVTDAVSLEIADPRNAFYLAIKAAIDAKELGELVVQHGKASSRRGVVPLEMIKVAGLRIESMPAAPTDIAAEAGFQYFRVEPHGKEWTKVREEGSFALSLGKLEQAAVRLYVVKPER